MIFFFINFSSMWRYILTFGLVYLLLNIYETRSFSKPLSASSEKSTSFNTISRTFITIGKFAYIIKHTVGLLLQKTLKRRKDVKWTAPQTTAQTLSEELTDPSSVQSFHVPREPALMGVTAGSPLSSWTAWPLSSWTAWPLSSWTAWPLSLWTAWPISSWWLT